MKTQIIDRILSKVKIDKKTGCWNWTGYLTGKGYASIYWNKKQWTVTRLFYFIKNKSMPPKNMYMCHHCDNPRCINLEHIFVGTPSDNQFDAYKKGRKVAPHAGIHKKFCIYGHEKTGKTKNQPICRVCNKLRMRRVREEYYNNCFFA